MSGGVVSSTSSTSTSGRMNIGGGAGRGAGVGAGSGVNPGVPGASSGAPAAPTEEDELTIPRAAMNKMLKELLPNVRIANESRELVLNCCSEFIHHIATHANEVCNQHHKKTINAEHILTALDNLGFSEYCEDAHRVFTDCKEVAAKRRKQSSRLEHLGVPEEELLRQQQELFAKARQEQAEQAQQDWANIQQAAVTGLPIAPDSDEDEY
ncbi:protein Dr1-like [Tropilaelaps mercedesae]|uniref:Protein Dr1 n=1 Tax=Tropilaelaps mercedesae TaxID=418985 RepID=A0A1V9XNS6_9ACAR|nr:protein Dr1-like [Tropilaelaps mercedesae]